MPRSFQTHCHLGMLGDDPDRMRAAAAYVELHRGAELSR